MGRGRERLSRVLFVAMIGVVTALIVWQGASDVGAALSQAGWRLLWLGPLYGPSLAFTALAWWLLFPSNERPRARDLMLARWVGQAVNWLLPVAQVGGELVRAVWLARRGTPGPLVGAAVVVDKTLQAAVQALIALIGVALLALVFKGWWLVPSALGFSLVLLGLLYVFARLQQRGLVSRLVGKLAANEKWAELGLVEGALRFDQEARAMYGRRRRLLGALLSNMASRLVLTVEVWLALRFMGHPVGILEALLLESLGQTVRAAAFLIPGAYGVQEGGFMLLGGLLGLPSEIALSVSLVKRVRELMIGVPALILWQFAELTFKRKGREKTTEKEEA